MNRSRIVMTTGALLIFSLLFLGVELFFWIGGSLEDYERRVSEELESIPFSLFFEMGMEITALSEILDSYDFQLPLDRHGSFRFWSRNSILSDAVSGISIWDWGEGSMDELYVPDSNLAALMGDFLSRFESEVDSFTDEDSFEELFFWRTYIGTIMSLDENRVFLILFDREIFFTRVMDRLVSIYIPEGRYLDNWVLTVRDRYNNLLYPAASLPSMDTESRLPFIAESPFVKEGASESEWEDETPFLQWWSEWVRDRSIREESGEFFSPMFIFDLEESQSKATIGFEAMDLTLDQWFFWVRFGVYTALGLFILLIIGGFFLLYWAFRKERSLRARETDFLSSVTHELKTPLFGITSASENLADGLVSDPDQMKVYGQILRDQSRRLGTMIEDVLFYSRLQNRSLDLVPVDLSSLMNEIIVPYRTLCRERGITLSESIPEGFRVMGNSPGLRTLVENLLNNAMIHGGSGLWIGVSLDTNGLTVEDRGSGIPRRERRRILKPFVRGRSAQENQNPGSGLGLSLVVKIVRNLGTRLIIEDAHPRGARIRVPLRRIEGDVDAKTSAR